MDTMMMSTSENVFLSALSKYNVFPEHLRKTIETMNEYLYNFVNLSLVLDSTDGLTCVVTDLMEEFDDLVMVRYGVYNTQGTVIVIVSGGYYTPDQRLEYLSNMFTCFKGAQFDVEFPTPKGTIIFKKDGDVITEKVRRFINCGPCNSVTLQSIKFVENPIIITIGANPDSTLGAGINQKNTNEPGKLIVIPNVWNTFIENARENDATIKNLDVELSRYVLFPNPTKSNIDSPFYELAKDEIMNEMIQSTAMFIISRPPPEYGLRVNTGNSIIDIQFYNDFKNANKEWYQRGLDKLDEYTKLSNSKGLTTEHYESAAIPIMITNCIGGEYKQGIFGFGPTDKHARKTLGCLTPESAELVIKYIKKMDKLTPAYDPLGYIMAFI
jgi:hypothetical protein